MITTEDLKAITWMDVICVPRGSDKRGPERWRVNGATKLWKTDADRVRVPLKHGLHEYSHISNVNLHHWNALGAYISKGAR